ncbi:MAG: EI24 domain-containing protein [Leptonema sp. (in: bacteria)]
MQYFLNPFKSLKLFFKLNLQKYFWLPFFITILLSFFTALGIYFLINFIFRTFVVPNLPEVSFFSNLIYLSLTLLIFMNSFFFFVVFYRFISQIVVLPFLDGLRTKLCKYFAIQEDYNTNIKSNIKNFFIGIGKSLLYIVLYFFFFGISFLLGPFQPIFLFLFDSYILGTGIYDVYLEKKIPEPRLRSLEIQKRRKEIFLTGMASTLMLLIPIVGIFISFLCGYMAAFLNDYRIKKF